MTSFDSLPPEILCEICHHLDDISLARLCLTHKVIRSGIYSCDELMLRFDMRRLGLVEISKSPTLTNTARQALIETYCDARFKVAVPSEYSVVVMQLPRLSRNVILCESHLISLGRDLSVLICELVWPGHKKEPNWIMSPAPREVYNTHRDAALHISKGDKIISRWKVIGRKITISFFRWIPKTTLGLDCIYANEFETFDEVRPGDNQDVFVSNDLAAFRYTVNEKDGPIHRGRVYNWRKRRLIWNSVSESLKDFHHLLLLDGHSFLASFSEPGTAGCIKLFTVEIRHVKRSQLGEELTEVHMTRHLATFYLPEVLNRRNTKTTALDFYGPEYRAPGGGNPSNPVDHGPPVVLDDKSTILLLRMDHQVNSRATPSTGTVSPTELKRHFLVIHRRIFRSVLNAWRRRLHNPSTNKIHIYKWAEWSTKGTTFVPGVELRSLSRISSVFGSRICFMSRSKLGQAKTEYRIVTLDFNLCFPCTGGCAFPGSNEQGVNTHIVPHSLVTEDTGSKRALFKGDIKNWIAYHRIEGPSWNGRMQVNDDSKVIMDERRIVVLGQMEEGGSTVGCITTLYPKFLEPRLPADNKKKSAGNEGSK